MKWVVFGSTITSSWANCHASIWRGLAPALRRRGVQLVFFERDLPYLARYRDLWHVPGGGQLCLYSEWSQSLAWARRQLAEADVALVTSMCPDGVAASRLVWDAARPLKVFWDLDTRATLEGLDDGAPAPYLAHEGLQNFDLVFTVTGGGAPEALVRQRQARRVVVLPPCVDPKRHRPCEARSDLLCDVSVVGPYSVDLHAVLERYFEETARRLPMQRFVAAGPQFPANYSSHNVELLRELPPADEPLLYASSRVTLSLSRPSLRALGHCPPAKLFEAAACGVPIVCDDWPGLSSYFTPGEEVLCAGDARGVIAALGLSSRELYRLATAARQRVLEQHTADKRAEEMIGVLEAHRHASRPARSA